MHAAYAAYRRACDTDKAQVNGWAQEQFSGWGSKWKFLWPDWLYKDAAFQQVYTEQRFQKRSDDLFKLLKDHARLYSILPDFLQQRRSRRHRFAAVQRSVSDQDHHQAAQHWLWARRGCCGLDGLPAQPY